MLPVTNLALLPAAKGIWLQGILLPSGNLVLGEIPKQNHAKMLATGNFFFWELRFLARILP